MMSTSASNSIAACNKADFTARLLPVVNQRMQKLLKGAAEGELSLARDHPFAFPKIDETRNAQRPPTFPHTCQMASA
jgi:hypothetical protein